MGGLTARGVEVGHRYIGVLLDANRMRVWVCEHGHRTRELAQACADKELVERRIKDEVRS